MSKIITRKTESEFVDRNGEYRHRTDCMEVVRTDTEPFFLTYSKQIMALYGKSIFNATTKVFWKLLEFAEWNTGKVYMTSERRDNIMETCSISRASYDRAVKELTDAGIMSKNGNTYSIDENMFWKGDRKTREQLKTSRLQIVFAPIYPDEDQSDRA